MVIAHGLGGGGHNTYMPFIDYFTSNSYYVFAYDVRGNDYSDGVEVLPQCINPDAPNKVWESDITYFKCNENAYYLCVIIDLYTRKVIDYKIGKKTSTQFIIKSTLK